MGLGIQLVMLVKSFNGLIMNETDWGVFCWKFCYFAAP